MEHLLLLPLALVLDVLFSEPPERIHPVCWMGAWAGRVEGLLRQGENGIRMCIRGACACLAVVLPFVFGAWGMAWGAGWLWGQWGAFWAGVVIIWSCMAPRCLARHAHAVAVALSENDLEAARTAVGRIVGRQTERLDRFAVARACVETVGENLTDGVLASMFWAAVGMCASGPELACSLAVLHRATNTLDAMWGKRNERYCCFGTASARLDDVLGLVPARLSLICVVIAAHCIPGMDGARAWHEGILYHSAHESPNSAWSEAAFAGALDLRLGGPAVYAGMEVAHPWLGTGTADATANDICRAVKLMWGATIVFCLGVSLLCLVLM